MSYKVFGGIHDILSSLGELHALGPSQREKGQLVAVRDGDYRIYIWDPEATAKILLCALSGEDPQYTSWPSKASMWYPVTTPSVFIERSHMVEEAAAVDNYSTPEDFSYLFAVPNDISENTPGYPGTVDYTDIPGRWVILNYSSIIDSIPWSLNGGHLIPRYNSTFDIGSAEKKVRHHFLSDNSIWLGDKHKVTIDSAGDLRFKKRKNGKLPEYLGNFLSSSSNPGMEILQQIQDGGFGPPGLDSTVDESTVTPADLDLTLESWAEVAANLGMSNPQPDMIFGPSDFEDVAGIGTGSGDDTVDPSNVGGYDLGDLSTRLTGIESKFGSDGKINQTSVPDEVLNTNISLEELITGTAPEYKIPVDKLNLDQYTKTTDLPNLPDWPMPVPDWVSSYDHDGVGTSINTLEAYFTDGKLNLANAADGLLNSNVPATDLTGLLTSADLATYATLTDLGQKANITDVPTVAGMNAAITTAVNGVSFEVSEITGLQAALDGKQSAGSYLTSVSVSDVGGLQAVLDGKQTAGTYLSPGDSIDASNINGVLPEGAIPTLSQSKVTGLDTIASSVTSNTTNIALNTGNISSAAADASTALSTAATAQAGVTSLDTWKADVFSEGSGNLSIDKLPFSLFGDTGTFKGTLGSTAKLADGVTTLSSNLSTLSNEISGLQTTVTSLDSSFTYTPLVTDIYTISDKDLKDIIRVVPQSEITTDYHLIGLTTVEYEWKPIANTLFGYSGHVQEGFIAEELETLFPAPDPQNPPTSIDDGHIWWHEYTTEEQKESDSSVHNYYTLVNTALLQAEIDAAIANSGS